VSGRVWSCVIDGVTVTVDVEATRATYAMCEMGLDCECGACRLLNQHMGEVLTVAQRDLLEELGADPLKPHACSWLDEKQKLIYVELCFELKGSLDPVKSVQCEPGIGFCRTGPSPRDQFGDKGTIQVNVKLYQERMPSEPVPPL